MKRLLKLVGAAFAAPTLAILLQSFVLAQPDTVWTKGYSNAGISLEFIRAHDLGYAIGTSGYSGIEERGTDFQLIKIDSTFEEEWREYYTRVSDRPIGDEAYSISQLPDEGYVLVGYSGGFVMLVRTDSEGRLVWNKFIDTQDGFLTFLRCKTTSDSNIVCIGSNQAAKFSDADSGEVIWHRTYGNAGSINEIVALDDGNFLLAGGGNYNFYACKIDEEGEIIWENFYGTDSSDQATSITRASDGGFCLAGITTWGRIGQDQYHRALLVRIDEEGNELWQCYDADWERGARIAAIAETPDGGFVASGEEGTHRFYLMRVDYFGEILWQRYYRGRTPGGSQISGIASNILLMEDDGYLMAGFASGVGCWLVRTEPDPVVIPFELSSSPTSNDFGEIFVDSFATYELTVTNSGRRYADILSADVTLGQQAFAVEFGEIPRLFPGDSTALRLVFSPDSAMPYEGVLSLFFGADTVADTLEIDLTGVGLPNVGVPGDSAADPPRSAVLLSVSPNPFNSTTIISFSVGALREAPLRLVIYDLSGRQVADLLSGETPNLPESASPAQSLRPEAQSLTWDASAQPAGVYFVRLQSGAEIVTQKVVLMR